jgi:hypothetical protein
MGLIEEEISELRKLLKQLDNGKITSEQLYAKIAIYSQTEKRAKLLVNAWTLSLKSRMVFSRLLKSNLIGDMVAIDIGQNYEIEKMKCNLREGQLILRHECLDISGQKENFEDCRPCANFEITRGLLMEHHPSNG